MRREAEIALGCLPEAANDPLRKIQKVKISANQILAQSMGGFGCDAGIESSRTVGST
jgi:hypothetical protein